jgi:hypothetical protein
LTPGGVLANYHTEGPLDGQSVVITHHTALRAILSGNLSVDEATERGLIAFSGNNASMVSEAFQIGVRAQI